MSEQQKETPDLSRIVSAIMQHPELISEIAKLGEEEPKPTEVKEEAKAAEPTIASVHRRDTEKRTRLLSALKPYLSESRSKAIDSILTFGEVFDMMRGGK